MPSPQLPLQLGAGTEDRFEHFYPGVNRATLELLRSVAGDSPEGTAQSVNSPLFLCGPTGSGKTHLLAASCNAARAVGRQAVMLSGPQLIEFPPDSLASLGQTELIAIDDVGELLSDRAWEEALFHLFNQLRDAAAMMLLSARQAPSALSVSLPDLRSRLAWGTTLTLREGDDADKGELLKWRAQRRGMQMRDDVAAFLIRRSPRDLPALVALVDRLDRASMAEQRRLTVPFVKSVLERS